MAKEQNASMKTIWATFLIAVTQHFQKKTNLWSLGGHNKARSC